MLERRSGVKICGRCRCRSGVARGRPMDLKYTVRSESDQVQMFWWLIASKLRPDTVHSAVKPPASTWPEHDTSRPEFTSTLVNDVCKLSSGWDHIRLILISKISHHLPFLDANLKPKRNPLLKDFSNTSTIIRLRKIRSSKTWHTPLRVQRKNSHDSRTTEVVNLYCSCPKRAIELQQSYSVY